MDKILSRKMFIYLRADNLHREIDTKNTNKNNSNDRAFVRVDMISTEYHITNKKIETI